jgi:hypothetical protein
LRVRCWDVGRLGSARLQSVSGSGSGYRRSARVGGRPCDRYRGVWLCAWSSNRRCTRSSPSELYLGCRAVRPIPPALAACLVSGLRRSVAHAGDLLGCKIVRNDGIAAAERWGQTVLNIFDEGWPVHRTVEDNGCNHSIVAQAGDEGDGLPMAMGGVANQSNTPWTSTVEPHHVGVGGGLVDKHPSVKHALLSNPTSSCAHDVGSSLRRGAQAVVPNEKNVAKHCGFRRSVTCASPQPPLRPTSAPDARQSTPITNPRASPRRDTSATRLR